MWVQRRNFFKWAGGILLTLLGGNLFFLLKSKAKKFDGKTGATPKVGEFLKEALYWEKIDEENIRCLLCWRGCIIFSGSKGFCRNRKNIEGKLFTLVYNFPCAIQVDPIEKEPVFHFLPGTNIFCLSTASCNFRCKFCHNWHISQRHPEEINSYYLTPEDIVKLAKKYRCPSISHTYAEPIVHFEYLLDVGKEAKKNGLNFIVHTNCSLNKEPLKELLNYADAITVDLKSISKDYYQKFCRATPEPVLDNLILIRKSNVHLEIVNLLLPVGNSDEKNIKKLVLFIKKNLGDDVPLHFTRFWPSYKLKNLPPTPVKYLERAEEIAKSEGLKYVYIGNVPGHRANSTYCPNCGKRIIHRTHFKVHEIKIKNNRCSYCGNLIPGRFS